MTTTVFEWMGTVFGLLGATLLALNVPLSRYGWVAFLAANASLILFSVEVQAWGLLTQQLGFSLTSALGIYRAFRVPSGDKK